MPTGGPEIFETLLTLFENTSLRDATHATLDRPRLTSLVMNPSTIV